MKIDNVTNNAYVKSPQQVSKQPKSSAAGATKIEDKIEISKEAKNKLSDIDKQKVETIKAKIANGDYNTDEVIGKVADKILEELNTPKE